jgi:hypothetical protein
VFKLQPPFILGKAEVVMDRPLKVVLLEIMLKG